MEDIRLKLRGFRKTEYYSVIMQLLNDGQSAGVTEVINCLVSNQLDNDAVKRFALQTKIFREIISKLDLSCDYAEAMELKEREEIEEQEKQQGGIIKWQR